MHVQFICAELHLLTCVGMQKLFVWVAAWQNITISNYVEVRRQRQIVAQTHFKCFT